MLTKSLYHKYLESIKVESFTEELVAFEVLTNSTSTQGHQIQQPRLELPFTNNVIGTGATLLKAEENLAEKLFKMVAPLKKHAAFKRYSYFNFRRLKKLAHFDDHFMNAYYDKSELYEKFQSLGINNQDRNTFMSLLHLNKLAGFESDHEIYEWLTESRQKNKVTKDWNE